MMFTVKFIIYVHLFVLGFCDKNSGQFIHSLSDGREN